MKYYTKYSNLFKWMTFVDTILGEVTISNEGGDRSSTSSCLDYLVDTEDWAQEWVDLLTNRIVRVAKKLQQQQ